MRPILAVIVLTAVSVLHAEDKLTPIKLDFSKKGATSQKVILPITTYTPEEMQTLSLDVRVEGLKGEQAGDKANLHMGKSISYRFENMVEVEFKLGISGMNPVLMMRTLYVTKNEKGKEKKSYVTLSTLQAKVEKLGKLVVNADGSKVDLMEQRSATSAALRNIESDINSIEREMSLTPENQRAQFEEKLAGMRAERAFLYRKKNTIDDTLRNIAPNLRKYGPELEESRKVLEALQEVQDKTTIKLKAYTVVKGSEKLVAETK